MIGMRDALTLAHTKIRSKRLRLIITTIVSGLVFGVMAGATILVDGMSKSLTEFARQNLDGRFLVSGTPNYYGPVDFNPSDATLIAEVQKYHAAGFEQIKIYGSLPPALVPVVTAEAHRLGITVTGHVPRGMTARQFIEAGADQINHMSFQSLLRVGREPVNLASDSAKAGIQFLLAHRTVLDPSLSRGGGSGRWRGHYAPVAPGVPRGPRELRVPRQSTGVDSARAVADEAVIVFTSLPSPAAFRQVAVGADGLIPGQAIRELGGPGRPGHGPPGRD